ncbi:MAG TPA: FtsH protease activity modulator HflK [Pseudomonadota bacterium]|nr:FtsH protease activity modulator HflK [Xanthomonadales bacterium]HQW64446.1 FtsH protease activity modulator HflK [Pseudomonadota bacterium]MBP7417767.1 FtsH protease activity modulator HflK [Xanthomonadales bacterium]HQX24843.1 FtsH protease activity modulator HflK [Pseudomonadota bacterium]HQY36192.1 FtsH protease activity modulator HflK [Pseudomonadota bacterium]
MAWNEPGGGKRRDPWQGGGDQPDLDAMLKRFRDGFGRAFGPPGGGAWLVVLAVLGLWFALDSWRTIDESKRGVVLRFGKFDRVMGAGLNFKWPRPIEEVIVVESARVRSTTDQVRMLTRDENLVIVDFNVQYLVSDPLKFLFSVKEPEQTLREAAESAVRQVIGANTMDTLLSGEGTALALDAKDILQQRLEIYGAGLSVSEFNFQNRRPPPEVKDAFDDAITAREDKQRIESEALAYASKVVPEARGQAARVRAEAEGYRTAVVAQAEGESQRFSLLAEQYRAAPQVTRKRLMLETMQDVLAGSPKVMASGDGDKVLYLPLDKIGAPLLPPVTGEVATPTERMGASAVPAVEASRNRDSGRSGREGRDR